jgi:hypothetical protein
MISLSSNARRLTTLFILSLAAVTQGCIVWRIPVTPNVAGTVIDAETRQPVAGAAVGIRGSRERDHLLRATRSDGTFNLPSEHVWRPIPLIPGDYWPNGVLFVDAPGYRIFQQEVQTFGGSLLRLPHAIELERDTPVTDWKEVAIPPESQRGDYMVWYYAGNYAPLHWHVYLKDGQPHAMIADYFKPQDIPTFKPKVKDYSSASDTLRVEDGWFVGVDQGEWGGALYWFSPDGAKNYKISDHQIVDLFVHQNEIRAIEGLSHLGLSRGSLITLTQNEKGSQWQVKSTFTLPSAPETVSPLREGRLLIALSDSIVSVAPDNTLIPILPESGVSHLSVSSSIVSTNESKLYLGMRQYVGELDLETKKLRLLVPSEEYIHELPRKEAYRIKKAYENGAGF